MIKFIGLLCCIMSAGMLQAMEKETQHEKLQKLKTCATFKNSLIGIQVYHLEAKKTAKRQCKLYNLSGVGYFYENTAGEILDYLSAEIVAEFLEQTENNKTYQLENLISFKIFKQTSKIMVAIMKPEYPGSLALKMFGELNSYDEKTLEALLREYNCDKLKNNQIYQVQGELEATETILREEVITALMERDQDLKKLRDKAEVIAENSEDLRIRTKKMNACCWIF